MTVLLMANTVLYRIHVMSDCGTSDIVSRMRDMFHDTVVTDFTDISDATLALHSFAK